MSVVWRKWKIKKDFLNLEQKQAEKFTIQGLVTDKKDLVKYNDTSNEICSYFKSLFEGTDQIHKLSHNTLLQSIALPSATIDQKVFCDNDLTDIELFEAFERNTKQ